MTCCAVIIAAVIIAGGIIAGRWASGGAGMTCRAALGAMSRRRTIAGMTPRHAVTLEDRHRTGRIIAGAIASAAPGKDRHRTAPAAGIEGRKA